MKNTRHKPKRLTFRPDMDADAVIRAMRAKYPRTTASEIIRGGLRALNASGDKKTHLFPKEKP